MNMGKVDRIARAIVGSILVLIAFLSHQLLANTVILVNKHAAK